MPAESVQFRKYILKTHLTAEASHTKDKTMTKTPTHITIRMAASWTVVFCHLVAIKIKMSDTVKKDLLVFEQSAQLQKWFVLTAQNLTILLP